MVYFICQIFEKSVQKCALWFLRSDYHSSYETLLHKSGKTTVNVGNLRNLCKDIFKSLKNLNPVFLKEIFYIKESNRPVREKCKLNIQIPKINQVGLAQKVSEALVLKFGIPCHTTLNHPKILIFSKRLLKTYLFLYTVCRA